MGTASILIVDDEKNMRSTMADILRDEGFEVSTAESGERALKLCGKQCFDVVLMDVRMPGIDGVEAFRRLRQRQSDVRVIMMSAYSVDELEKAALAEGAIAFLRKPLDIEKVLMLINEAKETAILLVEQDREEAGEISIALRERGYRVTTVHAAEQALELVEQIRFDLMFIDTGLGSTNGMELYQAIRERTPASVLILLADGDSHAERFRDDDVYAVVRKPVVLEHLLELLRQLERGER